MGAQTLLVSIGAVAICLLLPLTLVSLTLFRPNSKESREQLAEVNEAKSAAMHDLVDATKHGHLHGNTAGLEVESGGQRAAGQRRLLLYRVGGIRCHLDHRSLLTVMQTRVQEAAINLRATNWTQAP